MSSERPTVLGGLRRKSLLATLSTPLKKSSEVVARKCCACKPAAQSSKSDEGRPNKCSGDVSKAAAVNNSESRRRRSGLAQSFSHSRERCSVKVDQDASRDKCGKASVIIPQDKKEREVQTRRSTFIKKQPAMPPKQMRTEKAYPRKVRQTKVHSKDINAHTLSALKPESQARVGLSKQSFNKTHSSPNANLMKPLVPKQIREKKLEIKSTQGQHVRIEKDEGDHKASSSESDSDPDSDFEWSSDESSDLDEHHHIRWDGFADSRTGHNCSFCEKDLGVKSGQECELMKEFSQPPAVSILPCGHAFHTYCLDTAGFAALGGEPTCVFCESVNNS